MRNLALLGVGSLALALTLALAFRSSTSSAQTPAKPDSLVAWVLAPGDTANLKGPRQPIFFRHDIHVGVYKTPCQYCHYSVAESSEPGIPSMQTCMGCHLVIGGSDSSHKAEIKKLRDGWNNKQPIEWVRVHSVARHVHFPHMRHIKLLGPNACQSCHGDVARMPQVFCVTCHLQRNVNRDCTACHY